MTNDRKLTAGLIFRILVVVMVVLISPEQNLSDDDRTEVHKEPESSITRVAVSAREDSVSAPSAIVIGSGIAGLSAAYELEKAGFLVKVFEKHYMPGGRMLDDWMGPLFREVHAEEIFEGNEEMVNLADELGISRQFTVNQPDASLAELNPVLSSPNN